MLKKLLLVFILLVTIVLQTGCKFDTKDAKEDLRDAGFTITSLDIYDLDEIPDNDDYKGGFTAYYNDPNTLVTFVILDSKDEAKDYQEDLYELANRPYSFTIKNAVAFSYDRELLNKVKSIIKD